MKKRPLPAPALPNFARRVVSRLSAAEASEPDPWMRDDLRIAKLTVLYAASGEAVRCSPDVLASYMVLGLHPDKVWPAIQARRSALLGPLSVAVEVRGAPKKPPQSDKLWCEKTYGVRAANSHADVSVLREPTTSVPMAAPSIASLYPNSYASSSPKKRGFSYAQWLKIVRHSYAPAAIRRATLNALSARGPWPGEDGPADGIIFVSLNGMALGDDEGDGPCSRRTAQRRVKLACDSGYWQRTHRCNRWFDCPECKTPRDSAKCVKCGHEGRSLKPDGSTNLKEFCRPYSYKINLEKFQIAPPPKFIRHFCARTWKEHQEAAKRGEHPNVAEMPRKTVKADASTVSAPPVTAAPVRQAAAEPAHRTPLRATSVIGGTAVSDRATKAAEMLFQMCNLADIGAIPQLAISIKAEADFLGVDIEEAAKRIAECAIRDRKKGISLTRFYFRDLKWRSDGGRQTSAASERNDRIKRNILEGFAANARPSGPPDGPERED